MIKVILKDMPVRIKGFTKKGDGVDTIVLNSRLSYEQQRKSYQHEVEHLRNEDFLKDSVQQIEYDAHKGGTE